MTAGTPAALAAGSVYPDSAPLSPTIDCSTSGATGVAVYASSSTTVAAVAFSVSGTVITAGTPVTLYTTSGGVYTLWGYYGSHSIKMLSATSALYAGFVSDGSAGASNYHKACAMTISGDDHRRGGSGFCYRLNLSLGGSRSGSHLRHAGAGGAGGIRQLQHLCRPAQCVRDYRHRRDD